MKKSELFNMVITKVAEVCEIRVENIIVGDKHQSVVDARALCTHFLREAGLSNDEIALILLRMASGDALGFPPESKIKSKAKSIEKTEITYQNRIQTNPIFGAMAKEIRDFCLERYLEIYEPGMARLPSMEDKNAIK